MRKVILCVLMLICILSSMALGELKNRPDPLRYRPHILMHREDPFYIKWVGYNRQPASKIRRPAYTPIRGGENLWVIYYLFVWNDETDYPGRVRNALGDPEPVLVYVDDKTGAIVGIQTRWHNKWLPIIWVKNPQGHFDPTGHLWVYFSELGVPPAVAWVHIPLIGKAALIPKYILSQRNKLKDECFNYKISPIDLNLFYSVGERR